MKALLIAAREYLEALWDCTCSDSECERCAFLGRIDAAVREQPR